MKRTCKLTVWLIIFVILLAACAFALSLAADANAETAATEQTDPYEIPEDAGEVILDDPALFLNYEDEESGESVPVNTEETETPAETDDPEQQTGDTSVQESTTDTTTQEPTTEPTDAPTQKSTTDPTDTPMQEPTTEPTDAPTQEPTTDPTDTPTQEPTTEPTDTPTQEPTTEPTDTPTQEPTTEPTTEPTQEPTAPPVDPETLFSVGIKTPDWRNSGTANVRIIVTPLSDQAWKSVLYRIGDESWTEITGSFYAYEGAFYCDVEITENAKMTVRLATENDGFFDTSKEIRVFDYKPPVVTAGFREKVLHVEAPDDLSGVAGIQVNGLLFTTLEDGKLDVQMEEPLNSYKQLAIRGYDYAGNFSEPVTLDNPYYIEPTPEPTNTPKPTKKPSATAKPTKKPSSSSSSSGSATATPAPTTATLAPTAQSTQNPLISVVTPAPTAVAIATPEPVTQTVYVPIGPGQPYQQDGNMQTLDMLYSAATNKQFITVQTRAGETYFLIIDYDKPIDEENEIYETYFLNLVDDHDLLSVIEDESLIPTPTPQIVYVTPEPTEAPRATPIPIADDDEETDMGAMALLLVGVASIGGAALWFFKSRKKDKASNTVLDYDEYEFEEDEDTGEDS